MHDKITRDIFLAFVRVHILHHATEGRIYGLEMMEELRHHGYAISPGTLYPIFHALEKSDCLRASREVVNGKVRKYYVATANGRRALKEVRKKMRELVGEVME